MQDRTPKSPPVILPLADHDCRPEWSVMIPTFNCIRFLKETLQSVLAQDPGPELMQIEVIDDHSTDGDVEALVSEMGKGRVRFFRQSENVGSLRNFETCLNRSRGKLIHLLHGDDLVKDGFYKEVKGLFKKFPEAGAAFTQFGYIDEHSCLQKKERVQLLEKPGILGNWICKIAQRQFIQPPAIVVKRSVYEDLGGFYGVHYGEDWEMWIRIASKYAVAYSPACLAFYRSNQTNGANITSRSVLSAQNIKDISTVIDIAQNYLPAEKRLSIKNTAKKNFAIHYSKVANRIYSQSRKAAFAQGWGAIKMHFNIRTLFYLLRLYFMRLMPFVPMSTPEE